MSDLALEWDADAGAFDLRIAANDIVSDDGIRTSIPLSLFTDRFAEAGDEIPDGAADRRGWWADAHPVAPADKFGSRLWLLARAKRTPAVLALAESYAREALQWVLDDAVAERFDVVAEFLPGVAGFGITVTLYRPGVASPAAYRFTHTWAAEAARI